MKRKVSAKTFLEKYSHGEIDGAEYRAVDGFADIEMSGEALNGDTYVATGKREELAEMALVAIGFIKKP